MSLTAEECRRRLQAETARAGGPNAKREPSPEGLGPATTARAPEVRHQSSSELYLPIIRVERLTLFLAAFFVPSPAIRRDRAASPDAPPQGADRIRRNLRTNAAKELDRHRH
jgi:hypothetical protein